MKWSKLEKLFFCLLLFLSEKLHCKNFYEFKENYLFNPIFSKKSKPNQENKQTAFKITDDSKEAQFQLKYFDVTQGWFSLGYGT